MARIRQLSRGATGLAIATILLTYLPQIDAAAITTEQAEKEILQTDSTQTVIRHASPQVVTVPLANVRDTYFLVNISVNGHAVAVQLDTGSSDTWVVTQGYACVADTGSPQDTRKCGLGKPYPGLPAKGRNFSRFFGDGTFAAGRLGEADVAVGGLSVAQPIGMVERTHWFGDGQASGLLGLGYPSLTGMGAGNEEYDPVFTRLWKTGSTSPVFSLVLSRLSPNKKESYLSLGGVPSGVAYDKDSWARTPLLSTTMKDGSKRHGMYVIKPTEWEYSKRGDDGTVNTVALSAKKTSEASELPSVAIDAGSTLSVLPVDIATSVLAAFDPPAVYLPQNGAYYAPCDARVPTLGVKIGDGKNSFYFSPADLLRQTEKDATGRLCRVGITHPRRPVSSQGTTPYKLGITFLTSVVAVFDVDQGEMRFAQRAEY